MPSVDLARALALALAFAAVGSAAVGVLQLPLPAKTFDCASWNLTAGKVATPNPAFTKMYDLTGVPDIKPNAYPASVASGDTNPCDFHAQSQAPGYCNAECDCNDGGLTVQTCVSKGDWANTYDDGPSQFTPTVINTLKKYNDTKAMFFVIGANVCGNQQQLIDTVNAGHEIGVHTWSHPRLTSITNEEIIAEIKYTEEIIVALTGVTPKYMRPPFGNMDARVKFILDKMGYTAVHWTGTADTDDWNFNYVPDTPANEQAATTAVLGKVDAYIAADKGAKNGTISLEHDIARIPTSLADPVLAKIVAGGWNTVPVTKCLSVNSWVRGNDSLVAANGTAGATTPGSQASQSQGTASGIPAPRALAAVVLASIVAVASSSLLF